MRDGRGFESAAALLPPELRARVLALSPAARAAAEELRLRAGRGGSVLLPGGEADLGVRVTPEDLESVLETATRASAHTALEGVRAGFVTVRGGCRVGLCGEAAVRSGEIATLRSLSSLCIRIPGEVRGCAAGVWGALTRGGFTDTLIVSPPGAGKTTLLRELVRLLSDGGERVSLLDERGEAAAVWHGVPFFDVGARTDVMTGAPKKASAVSMLRSMSPTVLAMDEVTAPEDLEAVALAAGCGVRILAAVHGESASALARRPLYRELLALGVFRRAVDIRRRGDGGREYGVEELTC